MVKTLREKMESPFLQSDNINDYIGYTDYKPPRKPKSLVKKPIVKKTIAKKVTVAKHPKKK